MMFPVEIGQRAQAVIDVLSQHGQFIVTAESCTGGLIAGALTSVAGSSDAFYGGFVTYANEAKMAMIGVSEETLAAHGTVSEETAREMAEGARKASGADVAISVTGIAGPGGGSPEKPVGLVYFGCATPAGTICRKELYGDRGRDAIREATVATALQMVLDAVNEDQP